MALLSCAAFLAYYYWKGPSTLSWDYFETATTAHAIMVVALLIYWRLRQRQANDFARQIGIFGSAFVLLVATAYEGRLNGSRWFPYSRSGNWNPRTETTDFLKAALEPGERVVSLDRFAVPGLLFSYALPVAAGRSMPQAEYLQLLRMANPSLHKDHPTQSFFDAQTTDLKSPVWELANVNFFGASLEVNREYFERRYGDTFAIHSLKDGIILERRQRTKPYRITSHVVKLDSLEEIISTLQTRGLEPSILTDDPLFPPSAAPQPCPFVTKVTNYRQTSSAIRFSVTTEANQGSCPIFVMLSMAHDKGWRAYVDGKRTEPFSGFGLFPFVPLPSSGTHEVDFVFYPRFLGLGAILSALGVILLIFSVKTGLRTKQRVNTGPAE
jgi:hypothetical protein